MVNQNSILSILYYNYIKPIQRYLLVLFLFILFGLVGMYAFKWFAEPMISNPNSDDIANANFRTGEVQVYIFIADWCPHCKKAKPEWLNFKSDYDGKDINGQTLKLIDVDCTDGTDPRIQQYNINGYPTAFMMNGNQRIDFDSKITENNLIQFVNGVLAQ